MKNGRWYVPGVLLWDSWENDDGGCDGLRGRVEWGSGGGREGRGRVGVEERMIG